MLRGDFKCEEEVLVSPARLHCLISSSHLQELVHSRLFCRTLAMMIRFPAYSSRGSVSSLNCHLFAVSYSLLIFLNYEYVFLFSQSKMYGTTIPTLMLLL